MHTATEHFTVRLVFIADIRRALIGYAFLFVMPKWQK